MSVFLCFIQPTSSTCSMMELRRSKLKLGLGHRVSVEKFLSPKPSMYYVSLGIQVPSQKVIGDTLMWVLRVQVPSEEVLGSLGYGRVTLLTQ